MQELDTDNIVGTAISGASARESLKQFLAMWSTSSFGKGLKMREYLKTLLAFIRQYRALKKSLSEKAERAYVELEAALAELAENYVVGPISKVYIESVQRSFPERQNVFISTVETIPFIQFFGSDVYFLSISGSLPNTVNLDGKNTMINVWIDKLRGSSLLSHWQVAVLDFEDNLVYFYPFQFNIGESAGSSRVPFSMSAIVTRTSYAPLSFPGAQIPDDIHDYTRGEKEYFTPSEIALDINQILREGEDEAIYTDYRNMFPEEEKEQNA